MSTVGFLAEPAADAEAQRIFDNDVAELGCYGRPIDV